MKRRFWFAAEIKPGMYSWRQPFGSQPRMHSGVNVQRLQMHSGQHCDTVMLGTGCDDASANYVITLLALNPDLMHDSLLSLNYLHDDRGSTQTFCTSERKNWHPDNLHVDCNSIRMNEAAGTQTPETNAGK